MSAVNHQLILASAGTGKTYRLTNQFLGLLFSGVEPDRILATTFTRKAAGEILDRVLEKLVEGADDQAKCRELAEALKLPDLQSSDCLSLLAKLTKDIDSFRVRTIDAFFLGMVQLFALDLGLPPTWSIAGARLDQRLQSDALQDALRNSSPDEFLELLRELNQGSVSRSVHRSMLKRADDLRPIYLESAEGAWDSIVPTADVSDDDFDAALAAFGVTELPVTKAGTKNKQFQNAWLKLENFARVGDWIEVFKVGLCGKVMEGSTTYSRAEILEEHLEVIEPILQRASNRWLSNLVTRNRATYDLLDRFESAYEERKLGYGAFQFSDLPLALSPRNSEQSPLDERELDMWFRMDGRIDHLLLDEFQDTSPIQWRILEHIASEIVSDGTGDRSFFCVGDVKQSIYGFRQAEPRLLANLHNMLPGLEPERMDLSYRSSQTVLETVNLVFADIENNAAFRHDELGAYRRAGREWQEGFDTHQASSEKPGAAVLFEARPSREEDSAYDPVLELTVERVVALIEESPQVEIGILMRVRKFIPTLILRLKQRGISASGEGGNELVDSAAVLVYVSLLHLADHPDDSAAAFHVSSSPFGAYVGLEEGADLEARRDFARNFRRRLMNEGLGKVTATIALRVAADDFWSDWDQARFTQLLEQAFAFETEMGLRPSDFVDHLRNEKVEAPGGSRVRVMTVHASKGLEFECVLLPDLDRKIVGMRDRILTHRPQPDGMIEAVSLAPNSDHLKVNKDLEDLHDKATERIVCDGLSNMYVAMTRAAHRLELLIANRSERGKGKVPTMADFVLAALPADEIKADDTDGPIWSHSTSSSAWARSTEAEPADAQDFAEGSQPIGLATSHELRSLPRRSPSSEEGDGAIDANRLLAPSKGSRRGSLIHAWLEKLEWIEDFQLDREQMLAMGKAIEPDLGLRELAFDDLLKTLQYAEVKRALSRDVVGEMGGDRAVVHNEFRFSVILPEESGGQDGTSTSPLWTGSIDRLVLSYRGDEVVAATILDYKTDRVAEAGLAESVEFYQPQLDGYARVVAAQTGLSSKAITKRLLFLTPGRCIDLD